MPIIAAIAIYSVITAANDKSKARRRQREKDAALKREMDAYRSMDMKNPYLGMRNKFAGLENTMEDLTVNLKEAQFSKKMQMQQQADILQQMTSVAGGSGVASLAQVIANQGVLGAQQASAYIGQQEAANQKLQATEAQRLQTQEITEETRLRDLQHQGELMVAQFQQSKQLALTKIAAGQIPGAEKQMTAANAAYQDSLKNAASYTYTGTT